MNVSKNIVVCGLSKDTPAKCGFANDKNVDLIGINTCELGRRCEFQKGVILKTEDWYSGTVLDEIFDTNKMGEVEKDER